MRANSLWSIKIRRKKMSTCKITQLIAIKIANIQAEIYTQVGNTKAKTEPSVEKILEMLTQH